MWTDWWKVKLFIAASQSVALDFLIGNRPGCLGPVGFAFAKFSSTKRDLGRMRLALPHNEPGFRSARWVAIS